MWSSKAQEIANSQEGSKSTKQSVESLIPLVREAGHASEVWKERRGGNWATQAGKGRVIRPDQNGISIEDLFQHSFTLAL